MAEWSKAPDCNSGDLIFAGSNPALPSYKFSERVEQFGQLVRLMT
tara:strand:- start:1126 stop:1260 length:135 start_codon:yes stop_codon:yes gene_type:complete